MTKRYPLYLCIVLIWVLADLCTSSCRKANLQTKPPTVWADEDTFAIFCWFVIRGPQGQQGYTCVDASISEDPSSSPQGGGLFASIDDLRNALMANAVKIKKVVPRYPEIVPEGWAIRGLSMEELRKLGLHEVKWAEFDEKAGAIH